MTEHLVSAALHGDNTNKTHTFLSKYVYIEKTISNSRLSRRLHAIEE